MEYRVIWEIDVEAESYQEAAEQASALIHGKETTATVFDVYTRLDGIVLPAGMRVDASGETEPMPITLWEDTAR